LEYTSKREGILQYVKKIDEEDTEGPMVGGNQRDMMEK
jgi:hypothetical protein